MAESNNVAAYQYFALYFDICDWQDTYGHIELVCQSEICKPIKTEIHWVRGLNARKSDSMHVLHFSRPFESTHGSALKTLVAEHRIPFSLLLDAGVETAVQFAPRTMRSLDGDHSVANTQS